MVEVNPAQRLTLMAAVLMSVFGCGGSDKLEIYPTEALLLLDDEPFGPTAIMLIPVSEGGRSVAGEVDQEGKVKFTSYDPGDGAPAGQYRVAVGTVMAAPPKPFPVIYRDFDKSPLKVNVEAKEKNELVIAMDSKAGRSSASLDKGGGAEMLGRAMQDANVPTSD